METASQVPTLVDKDTATPSNEITIATDTFDYVSSYHHAPPYSVGNNNSTESTATTATTISTTNGTLDGNSLSTNGLISMTPQQQNIRRVIQWNPHQGLCGNTMTVTIEQQKVSHVPQMKIVFGMHPVETTQQHQIIPTTSSSISSPTSLSNNEDGGREKKIWITLVARVPQQQPGNTIVDAGQVPLSICVYENNRVDQWAFGTFTYDNIHQQQQQQLQQYNQGDEQQHYYHDYSTSSATDTPGDSGLSADISESYQLLQLLAPYDDPALKQPDPIDHVHGPTPTQATDLLAQIQNQQQFELQLRQQQQQQQYTPTNTASHNSNNTITTPNTTPGTTPTTTTTHYYYTSVNNSNNNNEYTYYTNNNNSNIQLNSNSPYRCYSQTPPSNMMNSSMTTQTPTSSSSSSSSLTSSTANTSSMVIHPFGGVLNKAHLKICGDLNDMTMNWTSQEWQAGRRLIQFIRNMDGETSDGHAQIECSFQPMDQQEHQQQRMRENMAAAAAAAAVAAAAAAAGHNYSHHHHHPGLQHRHQQQPQHHHQQHHHHHSLQSPHHKSSSSLVVSCIYWRERDDYYITSVDCIYLLEGLIGVQFTVEEKNRIRRNLEGFRPLTVSKCKPDCADFFKLIMGFPNPKPRNIEKDVKVFAWKTLPHALRKIIRKYTPSYSSTIGLGQQQQRLHHQQQQQQQQLSMMPQQQQQQGQQSSLISPYSRI